MRLKVLLVFVAVCVALMATESFPQVHNDTCYSAPDTCYVCHSTEPTGNIPAGYITELDLGVCDTVRIGCPVLTDLRDYAIGDSFPVQIFVYSSNAIGGFSLGFRHYGLGLQFGGYLNPETRRWDPAGGVLTPIQQDGILWLVDTLRGAEPRPDSGIALMGWVDMTDKRPIPRNTTSTAKLLGSVWMVLTKEIRQTIHLDSIFYPPVGPFILVCRDSIRDSIPGHLPPFARVKLTPQFVHCPDGDIILGGTPDTPCGDVEGSSHIDIADVVYMVNYIFRQGASPQDARGGDVDCDLRVTIADVVYLINHIFRAGPNPCLGCE